MDMYFFILLDGNATSELTTISKTQKGFMVSARTATAYNSVGGRKMALHKVMRLAKVKPQGATKGSNQVEGKFGSKQKMTYGGQKVNSKESKETTAGHFSAKIDEAAGFVAFNADYRAPRHHPPKNN
ncbi:hypothetical protein TorRG33x02_241880 [Trema orientale]|uniref:Uncharacterized protein n=1 Tax=Trema orientale TaxID=63057 RepID=A0A2P5DU10_TREOI|nr:hypothetical protein TorRG33x02_241880 [Trema orientale]